MSKWIFTDPDTLVSYTFEISPASADDLTLKRSTAWENADADDNPLVGTGGVEPRTESATGTIVSEAQYLEMLNWWAANKPIQLTDHLGRTLMIRLAEYSPVRVYSVDTPWKHTYTLRYEVMP